MGKKVIESKNAPQAIGPYSQAVEWGNFIFASGQIALRSDGGDLLSGSIKAQATLALENLRAVLEEAGSSMEKVVKTTIFLSDMAEFPKVNDVYAKFFPQPYPARSTIQVSGLPRNAKVEIDAIAMK